MNRRIRRHNRRNQTPVRWREIGSRLFWAGCLTLLATTFFSGSWFAYERVMASGYLNVREVAVLGARRVGPELADYLQLGMKTPLSRIEPVKIEGRLQKHPWIRTSRVEKDYPGKLVIHIEERDPALFHLASKLFVVDMDGAWIKPYDAADGLDLPVATGVNALPVTAATENLRKLAHFVRYWDQESSPVQIGEVHFLNADEVVVYTLAAGPVLHLPLSQEKWPLAKERLARVLIEAKRIGVQLLSIDLLYPDRAVAQRKT